MTAIGKSPSDEQRDRMKLATQARMAAIKSLIAAHSEEYDELHRMERNTRGLGGFETTEQLRRRIQTLEAEVARLTGPPE